MDVMTSAKAKRGVSMGRDAPLKCNASSLLDSPDGRKIHFAIMAIESGARKLGIDGRQMHDRLKAQDLIHKRLLGRYETLHTQSRQYVADDIVETLQNWESDK